MSTLYENIKELCEAKGISGGKMCLEIGISKSTLTSLKNGRTKAIKTENIQKIADYFGVSVDRVLYGKYPEPLKIQYEGYRTGREDERNHQKELLELSDKKEKPPVDDERFLPLAERREALSKAGIHILLDADAKVTEDQLDDIISFIEIQQRRNGR